ncbi:hypothetical protein Slala05_83860 [Streptomyces lavendulae subsp. lavendulae]|nr:hypothetical protein Slala05_83860 [Streptomyces lavendulae subsp. lavendulae]
MSDTVAKMNQRGQEPVDEDQTVLRASANGPLARPGLQPRLMSFLPYNGPTSATSSAITSDDSPVILRSLMITARAPFPTTRT